MANLLGEISVATGNFDTTAINSKIEVNNSLANPFNAFTNSQVEINSSFGVDISAHSFLTSQANFIQSIPYNLSQPLARIFGANAKQDISKIYINKVDLPGLTANSNNSAESLLIALLLQAIKFESSYESRIVVERRPVKFVSSRQQRYINFLILVKGYVPVTYVSNTTFNKLNSQIAPTTMPGFSPQNY